MWNNRPIISKIKLKNFKCHAHFEEELNYMTILAGENSAGKSSVIQSILLLDSAIGNAEKSIFTMNVHGLNLGIATNIITESSGSNETDIDFVINNNEHDHVRFELTDNDDVRFMVSEKVISSTKYELFYINAERLGPRAYNNISSLGSFYVGTHGENTIYVLDQMDKIIKTAEFKDNKGITKWQKITQDNLLNFSSATEKCLQEIIPGTKLNAKSNAEQGTVAIRYSNGMGTEVIPTATGFGITYVLPIIVQALVSLLFTNSVLIVENPEAHLHPYSQSHLGRFLAKVSACGIQVIVETHSEHFINGCRLELANLRMNNIANIMFFNRNLETHETEHTLISIDESGELSSWPEGFFDQSERDLFEVIKNKCKK